MTRRLLNLLTALSLLLCVAVLALWVRSYFRSDGFGYQQRCSEEEPRGDYWLYSTRGRIRFLTALIGLEEKETGPFWKSGFPDDPYRMEETGWYVLSWELAHYPSYAHVSTPHWVPAMLLAAAPSGALLARLRRRRRRSRGGLCPECGTNQPAGAGA